MGGVYETQLYPGDGAAVSVCEQHSLAEIGGPAQSAHFADDPLALRGQSFHGLLRRRLMNRLAEKPENIRIAPGAVKRFRVHRVGHEHIRPDTDGYFIVAFSMEAQTFSF